MIALTPSGKPITCDGCNAFVEEVRDDMVHPASVDVWGPGVVYIVCRPLPNGDQPCLTLAQLSDDLYRAVRCQKPGCAGC
ncbi:hypothetical protein ACIHFD_49070 [Nonomuraea sp. NPDC051941]|uniref:hypothetical protein n=1 Tax=Nonomuraea sp. NPDC051941 TaxID=3364373 RepID=UPI0037CADFFA